MNVISGKYKNRKLLTLKGLNTRPTTQRVKEDIFNILDNYFIFSQKISLDLFGGSGALSIEGLSRGILKAYINDNHKPALDVIKKNLRAIDKTDFELFNIDYQELLKYFSFNKLTVDLIYLDPPFAMVEYYYIFFAYILKTEILNNYGIVITESKVQLDLNKINHLVLLRYKSYKKKHLYIFRREDKR